MELFTDIHKNTGKIRKNILGYSGGPKKTESEEDDGRYELMNYGFRLVDTDGRGALVFQSSPDGSFMNQYQFSDGEPIYVNLNWREDGYGIAYEDGVYGYVDAGYINWDVEPVSEIDDRFDLTSYEYRRVKTNNSKGALVFQSSPNGSFMNRYQFWNGDRIFVHPYWRQDGYAICDRVPGRCVRVCGRGLYQLVSFRVFYRLILSGFHAGKSGIYDEVK